MANGSSGPRATDASSRDTPGKFDGSEEVPGKEGSLVVGELPPGWTFHHDVHPKIATGEPVMINFYQGAPIELKTPGGGQAYQQMVVNASYVTDLQESGRAQDLLALVSSDKTKFTETQDTDVLGRPALLLARPIVSGPEHTVAFTIGDWLIQVIGASVEPTTLLSFAEEVSVR